ncbi:hypothetical protein GCM10027093_08650 [Paraburkholderia jirisanensis]
MRDLRSLVALYAAVYIFLAITIATLDHLTRFGSLYGVATTTLWGVTAVALSEHAALEGTSYLFSLQKARSGSVLLFLRTGAWAAVAILGLLCGLFRSISAVFALWCATNVIAVTIAWWMIRRTGGGPKQAAANCPPSLPQSPFRSVWFDGLPFYIATMVLSGLQYAERFVVSGVVSADMLGQYVFAWSVANSIQTVCYATIVVTAAPRLARALSSSRGAFMKTLYQSLLFAVVITSIAAALVLTGHKVLFRMAHEPSNESEFLTLSVLLVSFVMRSVCDVLWSGIVALRKGKDMAISISVIAAVSIPMNYIFVGRWATLGAAFGHLLASASIVTTSALIARRQRVVTGISTVAKGVTNAS